MPRISLKTRMTLILPVAISLMMTGVLFLVYMLLQTYIKETISTQQYQLVSMLADEIDHHISDTQGQLVNLSRKITGTQISNPASALAFLRNEPEHLATFDNGLFLFDRQGRILAEIPLERSREGQDFSFRDYIKETIQSRQPVVSAPYISSKKHHHPAIMFTVPVFDGTGEPVAILGGSVDLLQTSFIDTLTTVKIGSKGYLYLISSDRTLISHPDKSRVMKSDTPAGINKLLDRAIKGFNGTDETVTSRGLHSLTSFRHLKTRDWIIAANYPISEAYAPIYKIRLAFLVTLILVTGVTFRVLRRYLIVVTAPLVTLTRHIEAIANDESTNGIVPVSGYDEVAVIGHSFNNLLNKLNRQREELAGREILYRTVVEFSSEMVFWLSPDRETVRYVSPSCLNVTGYSAQQFFSTPHLLNDIIHPDDKEQWLSHCQVAGESNFHQPFEMRIINAAGETRWVSHLCRSVHDSRNEYAGIRGSLTDITPWKGAEATIVASEEKFRIFFNESSDAIFIIGDDGRIREANREAFSRYGYPPHELIGMSVAEIDTPEQAPEIPMRVARIIEAGHFTFETMHKRKDDSPLAMEVNASRISYQGEQAILAIARDITERRKLDTHLRRQNEYLLALHETTIGLIQRHDVADLLQAIVTRAGNLIGTQHCYIYLKTADGSQMNMVFQSGVFDNFVHYPINPGEGVAGYAWEMSAPFHVDHYSDWAQRLPDPDRDILGAMAGVPLKSGSDVIGVLGLAFLKNEGCFSDEQMEQLGQFGELASLALDNARLLDDSHRELAERKKAETSLRTLSVAVEQNPASILITDTYGTIEYVNPRFTDITGYSAIEAIGQNPRILKGGSTTTEEYSQLWSTILAGGVWRGEFHNRTKDGELYWEEAVIAPIRDDNGTISHFIAIKEDITERKRLENQLHHAQKMEAIGQLAGGIAHDFNNILTAIIGYATIMNMKMPKDAPYRASTEQIIATAERGASLTQGLLAFSRKQVTNPVTIDMNEVITRVRHLLRRLISEDISLDINTTPTPLTVLIDSIQIEQVVMNLATNARDAMPKGGTITIHTERVELDNDFIIARGFGQPGSYAMLTFTDDGDGMDDETTRHVFEPFYTTKEMGKGTGLGLSIVYGIIKKHNGYISCHSTPGIGTTFQVYLPIIAGAGMPEPARPATGHIVSHGSETILLAEDDDSTRSLTRELLEEFGYNVIEAVDGADAVDKFTQNSHIINLLILDVIMPKLKGQEVYDAVQAVAPATRVLFYSGYTYDVVVNQGMLKSDINFISKPFSPKELLMKIREVLEHDA